VLGDRVEGDRDGKEAGTGGSDNLNLDVSGGGQTDGGGNVPSRRTQGARDRWGRT